MQNVVNQMEPYGQISNGIEMYTPPIDVSFSSPFFLDFLPFIHFCQVLIVHFGIY